MVHLLNTGQAGARVRHTPGIIKLLRPNRQSRGPLFVASGLSVVPRTPVASSVRPVIRANGIVNLASQLPALGQGMPISIYGRNLGSDASAAANWPPNMGDVCVTINTTMLPPDLTPGRYTAGREQRGFEDLVQHVQYHCRQVCSRRSGGCPDQTSAGLP